MTLLVDDQLLSILLRGGDLPVEAATVEDTYTTGYWYVRLCQAVLGVVDRPGALSAPFAALQGRRREQALAAILELPPAIGLLSLRDLGPRIARLRPRHQLNILGMEALAAATELDASVALSTPSPRLEESLEREGCAVTVVS